MTAGSALEGALKRDRVLTLAALAAATALGWAYILLGAGMKMGDMDAMAMPLDRPQWSAGYVAIMVVMWAVMMAAMMLPSAAPMILLYGTIARRRGGGGAFAGIAAFLLGYMAVWAVFSVAAVALQFALDRAVLLSPTMRIASHFVAGGVLIGAGLYQWTPLKNSCLRRCRSPFEFVMTEWREGKAGALAMGARHGLYCLGCCWALMLLLFVGGVMNVAWIAGLALFVSIEKVAPAGHWIGRAAGALLIVIGAAMVGMAEKPFA